MKFNLFKKTPIAKATHIINAESDSYMSMAVKAINNMRAQMTGSFNKSPNGNRDYNNTFGYVESLTYPTLRAMYERGGMANVIVKRVATTCWRDMPKVKIGDTEVLESEMQELKRIGLFKALEKADILNRIGTFSVLLMGIPDGQELDKPLGTAQGGDFESMYFRCYSEEGVVPYSYDMDPASPRFGFVILYQLQTVMRNGSTMQQQAASILVHYSRVVHMAEGSLESDLEGSSSLEAPWNCLVDVQKVRGSAAESYYRNSRQKLSLETNPGVNADVSDLKAQVEAFQDGYQDTLRLNGMKANMLQPSMASPRDASDIAKEECSGITGIPLRILSPKAVGVMTGAEDKSSWNALIKDRCEQVCELYLLDALTILSNASMLTLPPAADIIWPTQSALNEKEEAEIVKLKGDTFKAVIEGLSTIGADEVDAESVFQTVGLDIKLMKLDFSDDVTTKGDI